MDNNLNVKPLRLVEDLIVLEPVSSLLSGNILASESVILQPRKRRNKSGKIAATAAAVLRWL